MNDFYDKYRFYHQEILFHAYHSKINTESKPELDHYLRTAKAINSSSNYSTSMFRKVDHMIGDLETFTLEEAELENDIENFERRRVSKKTFVSIITPTLCGKTQLAFSLTSKRPLYFNFASKSSELTKSFGELSRALKSYLSYDIEHQITKHEYCSSRLQIFSNDKNENSEHFGREMISCERLETVHYEKTFASLGFLLKLVLRSKDNYDSLPEWAKPSWMKYLSQLKDFAFDPVSIKTIKEQFPGVFDGYCLYLDDYDGPFHAELIRNLARALGITCVIAGSHRQMFIYPTFKRTQFDDSFYSIVVSELGPADPEVLDATLGIISTVNTLQSILEDDKDKISIAGFFKDFFEIQIPKMRIGVSVLAVESIKQIIKGIQNGEIVPRAKELFLNIVICLAKLFMERIPHFNNPKKNSTITSHLTLFLSYIGEDEIDYTAGLDTSLTDHMHHLDYDSGNNAFHFTFRPHPTSWSYFFRVDGQTSPLYGMSKFKHEETLTSLACYFLPMFTHPIGAHLVKYYYKYLPNVNRVLGRTSYPFGDHVMVVMRVSAIESSHFVEESSTGLLQYTFNGVPFNAFLKSFLRNLVLKEVNYPSLAKRTPFNLIDEGGILANTLENYHVPFLGPCDREMPDAFRKLSSAGICNFGIIESRTSINILGDKIAFQFDIQKIGSADSFKAKFGGTEYGRSKVHVDSLHKFIKLVLKRSSATEICFFACFQITGYSNQIVDERFPNVRELMDYVTEHKINLYRFESLNFGENNENISMKIVPFRQDSVMFADAKLHCFVIEHLNFGDEKDLEFIKYYNN